MSGQAETRTEIRAFLERLTALAQAGLRINESLDPDTVTQEVLDCARSLTGADYGILALVDDQRRMQQLLWSGLTDEESHQLHNIRAGQQLCEYISAPQESLRLGDFRSHLESMGFDGLRVPIPGQSGMPFLVAPIIHHGRTGGGIFLANLDLGRKFTP